MLCPCGSNEAYAKCCGPFIDQGLPAPTAESLMRSRYTAYTQKKAKYILSTWHPDFRPQSSERDFFDGHEVHWLSLEVIRHQKGLKKSTVEFKATFQSATGDQIHHELSQFIKIKSRWYYSQALPLSH